MLWRRPPRRIALACCIAAAIVAATAATAQADSVSGTVFYDANMDGVRALDPDDSEPRDLGVAGVTVQAFGPDGTQLATTTSNRRGRYRLELPAGIEAVRVEFSVAPPLFSTMIGEDSLSSVQFVSLIDDPTVGGVDFGVQDPAAYCEANPLVALGCVWPEGPGGFYADRRTVGTITWDERGNNPEVTTRARFRELGAIYGVGARQGDPDSLWVGARLKRLAGYGSAGPGGIYLIRDDTVSLWATVPDAGPEREDRPGGDWSRDFEVYGAIGKESLGDLDILGDRLYVVNLFTRSLVEYDVDSPAPAEPLRTLAIGDPGCPGGPDDWRPYGLGTFRGELYVGGVCSGEASVEAELAGSSSRSPGDIEQTQAVVLRADLAASTFVEEFRRTLDMPRGSTRAEVDTTGWNPWLSVFDPNLFMAESTTAVPGTHLVSHPQPMLSDIAFDANGSMILGFLDRFGDQTGSVPGPAPGQGDELFAVHGTGGDINRVCRIGDSWVWEGTGNCPSNFDNLVTQRGGIGNVPQPQRSAQDEYYPGELLDSHQEIASGAIAFRPRFPTVATTAFDPTDESYTQGVRWLWNRNRERTGLAQGGLEFQRKQTPESPFGKTNGMTDIELLCENAPLEIGNRVWFDADRDGVQDPGLPEPALPNVEVELWQDGRLIARTRTDSRGVYYFNGVERPGDPVPGHGFVPGGLDPNADYEVRIATDQPALEGFTLTTPNTPPNDAIDSDGTQEGNYAVARVRTGDAGHIDHTHDFGFHVPPPGEVTVVKNASRTLATVGDEFFYLISVVNTTSSTAPDVVIEDELPDIVRGLDVTSTDGRCTLNGARVRCRLGDIAPGAAVTIHIDVRAVRPGIARNGAVLDRPRPPSEPPPASVATVVRRSSLVVRKVANRRLARRGQRVRYRVRVRNVSRTIARDVRICDALPRALRAIRAPGARVTGRRRCWTIGELAPGHRRTVSYTARVRGSAAGGRVVNVAVATAQGQRRARVRGVVRVLAAPAPPVTG